MTPYFPLRLAMLCSNCQALFRVGSPTCPNCAGESIMPLERWFAAVEVPT